MLIFSKRQRGVQTGSMEASDLTFVNTTDAPHLSKAAARQVRGHITRKVLAARRERKDAVCAKIRPFTAKLVQTLHLLSDH